MPTLRAKAVAIATELLIKETTRSNPMDILARCPPPGCSAPEAPAQVVHVQPKVIRTVTPPVKPLVLANTQETITELKRRLGKELYRIELDLQNGGRIAGKPCDCLSKKHHLGIEATSEELMSYEQNPVYGQIIDWMNEHAPSFEPQGIAKTEPSYYQSLTPDIREFRKKVMGTADKGVE